MEATNFANRHEILGAGTHTSLDNTHKQDPPQTDNIYENTVKPGPTLRGGSGTKTRGFTQAQDPGNNSSSPIQDSSQQAKTNTIRATEIGDPNGRIPTAEKIHKQLNDARDALADTQRNSSNPSSSNTTQGVPRPQTGATDTGVPTSQRAHRNNNYASGYEGAADAVKHKSHNAEDHRPSILAHEPIMPLKEVAPDLDGTTEKTSGPGTIPGPSMGQKAKAPFAKIHGAGEVLRGNLAAAADSFTGDKDKQAEDEGIVRKGQEEFTNARFDRGEVVRGKVNSCIAELAGEESTRDIEEERTRRGKREMINQEREREPSPLPTRTRNM
ncbi:hypothetical protein DHEL01_v205574 [Diaporthe helianthi]|uniref:Uncharacterized protein n=1 Tax=Diaporthe helianthi TaxID=158607 RepID=A0A2P5I0H8_DIAHE|nr:hypothetical protein DHEL01_v205574 [Diaporthe helianthi]